MNEKTKRIAGLGAGHGAVDFYIPVIPALLPSLIPLFAEQGITSYAMTALLFTTVTVMMVIFQPLSGWLIDKNKWTPGTSLCVVLTAVSIALFGVTQNYWILLLFAMVLGFANSAYHPNAYQQIHQFTTQANRGTFMALMSVGGTFGYGAAPLVTGAVFAWGGWPALLWLLVPGLIVAICIRRLPQHPLPTEPRGAAASESADVKPHWGSAGIVLAISSIRSWVYYGFIAFGVVYLTKYSGVEYVLATAVVSCMIFAGMFGTLTAGPLSDKIGRKEVMFAAYIGGAVCYAGVFLLSGVWSVIALAGAGFFMMATASVEIATVQELMPGSVGFASGIVIGIPQGMAAVSIVVVGVLADMIGMPTALFIQVFLMIAAIVLCAALPYPLKLFGKKKAAA
ncbi:MAG: MFS transporter [Methanocorpusculum sp.]|nr:MFS transporter [Methanocorpusculum sp.]